MRSKLLHLAGTKVQDIFDTLPDPPVPDSGTALVDFEKAVAMLDIYFAFKPNISYERHAFRRLCQLEDESVAQFANRLNQQAALCSFHDADEQIKDQLIEKIRDDALRKKLLDKDALTLKDALEVSRQHEATEASAREMSHHAAASVHKVFNHPSSSSRASRSASGSTSRSTVECGNCGSSHHATGASNCPAIGQKCLKCGKKGHYRRKCRSKKERKQHKGGRSDVAAVSQSGAADAHSLGSSVEYSIGHVSDSHAHSDGVFVTLMMHDLPIRMEVDTGASLSIVPQSVWKTKWNHLRLEKSDRALDAFGGSPLEVVGEANVSVAYGDQRVQERVVVVKNGSHPLLGRNWLAHIRLDWKSLFGSIHQLSEKPNFMAEFPSVFQDGLGTVKDHEAEIHLDNGARPRCCNARPVPYALRSTVDAELDRLEREGIIKPVKSAEWASPLVIVKKKNGTIRLCADFKVTINPHINANQHPIPNPNELLSRLAGGSVFSTLDLSQAYAQLPLSQSSQRYCVIATHRGLYAFQRLPFGVASAPAIWQKTMDEILSGFEGVVCFFDDVLITGATEEEHNERLRKVLRRLAEYGIRLRLEKCKLAVQQVRYLGFTVSGSGLQTNDDKVSAITNAPAPKDVASLQSFMGLVTFYSRFIPNFSSVTQPLRQLLAKNVPWAWTTECDKVFRQVKDLLVAAPILAHFDVSKKVIVECDASPYGLGACLLQESEDGSRRPVCFVSRSLASAEAHYSQIEREALSIVFAVKRLHMYLYGRTFTLRTDHKPLLRIFGEHSGMPATAVSRLQRWAVILSEYDYQIEHIKGTSNVVADCLSRLPLPLSTSQVNSIERAVQENAFEGFGELPISAADIAKASTSGEIGTVMEYLKHGWPADVPESLKPYRRRADQLTIEASCLIWKHRTVIPIVYRRMLLQELHSMHLGMSRMKAVARSFFWWPGLDDDIEKLANSCTQCLESAKAPPKDTAHHWIYPTVVFERIHIDYAEFAGHQYLLLVDAYSKWVEVYPLGKDASALRTIDCLLTFISTFGIPHCIVSDNGPQFTSAVFADFCKEHGITHKCTPPYHPSSNGQVERLVQEFKKSMRARASNVSERKQVKRFLFMYRNTPHSTTQVTPASLIFKHLPTTKFSLLKPSFAASQRALQNDTAIPKREFKPDDSVLVLNTRNGSAHKWSKGIIMQRLGPVSYAVRLGEHTRHVHIDHLQHYVNLDKSVPTSTASPVLQASNSTFVSASASQPAASQSVSVPLGSANQSASSGDTEIADSIVTGTSSPASSSASSVPVRHSTRTSKPPSRLIESM